MRLNRTNVSLAVLAAAMLCLDAVAAALGWWMRPVADSWCTAVQVRDQGVFPTAWHMYAHENGRLAAAFANSVSGLHQGAAERLFPAVTIALAFAASMSLYAGLRRVVFAGLSRLAVVLLAATTTACALLLGRSAYQSFLWAPGAITHTWPVLIAMFAVAAGLRVADQDRARWWAAVGTLLGFLASTFDEVTAVLLLTLAAIALADRRAWRRGCPGWVAYVRACTLGVLAGVVALYASPGFHSRSAGSHLTLGLLAGSVGDAAHWVVDVLTQWPLVGLLAIAMVVGYRGAAGRTDDADAARRVVAAPGVMVLVALVVDVVALRVGYGPTGPDITPRAFSEFFVPAVIACGFYGLLLGRLLARRAALDRGRPVVVLLATVAILAAVSGLAWQTSQLTDVLRARARAWDAQNARIERASNAGVRQVHYTPLPVAGLADPFWLAGYHDWVAGCVKSYYHVATLRDGRYVR